MAKFESMEFNIFELVLINLDEFADLCNAIALRFQKEDVPSCFENLPSIYHSPFSEKLKAFIRSTKFGYMISIILIVNLVAVIVETTLDIQESSLQSVWQEVEFVFGWIYVLEMALKIYSYGFENYWRDGQNRFDFLVTWVIDDFYTFAVIGETITLASPNGQTFLSNGEWIRYLLLARMLRLIRLLMHVQQYRGFVATFLTLIPSLMPYLGTIFCVQCIYCSLGVQIFGGIVNAGNAKLEETDLADDEYPYCYLLFNFNDYPNGMVTLFNLLVMGNWQVWMQVIAFVLEAFFAEMELESSEKCEEEDKDGEPRERRRRVGTKTRSQRVDVLLHHMLSAELQKSCDS
ncbi:Two pore calcium channel protein 1 [Citrus sinensis]|nr:Two pore calcium channel protein 1 [Citrus sinensis]